MKVVKVAEMTQLSMVSESLARIPKLNNKPQSVFMKDGGVVGKTQWLVLHNSLPVEKQDMKAHKEVTTILPSMV